MQISPHGHRPSHSAPIVLGLLAAAALFYACVTNHWLVNVGYGSGFGLRAGAMCLDCSTMSNAQVVDAMWMASAESSGVFAATGWATFVLLAIGGVALVVASILAIARVQRNLPLTPTTVALVALMLGMITGCVFVATKPGPPGWVGVGTSFWSFGVGAVLGIAAAQQLARVNRPPDPDLLADPLNPDQF